MILALTRDEASLVRYALLELSNKRAEQALDSRGTDWGFANEQEARTLRALADQLSETAREGGKDDAK